jgi:hypothetical protein
MAQLEPIARQLAPAPAEQPPPAVLVPVPYVEVPGLGQRREGTNTRATIDRLRELSPEQLTAALGAAIQEYQDRQVPLPIKPTLKESLRLTPLQFGKKIATAFLETVGDILPFFAVPAAFSFWAVGQPIAGLATAAIGLMAFAAGSAAKMGKEVTNKALEQDLSRALKGESGAIAAEITGKLTTDDARAKASELHRSQNLHAPGVASACGLACDLIGQSAAVALGTVILAMQAPFAAAIGVVMMGYHFSVEYRFGRAALGRERRLTPARAQLQALSGELYGTEAPSSAKQTNQLDQKIESTQKLIDGSDQAAHAGQARLRRLLLIPEMFGLGLMTILNGAAVAAGDMAPMTAAGLTFAMFRMFSSVKAAANVFGNCVAKLGQSALFFEARGALLNVTDSPISATTSRTSLQHLLRAAERSRGKVVGVVAPDTDQAVVLAREIAGQVADPEEIVTAHSDLEQYAGKSVRELMTILRVEIDEDALRKSLVALKGGGFETSQDLDQALVTTSPGEDVGEMKLVTPRYLRKIVLTIALHSSAQVLILEPQTELNDSMIAKLYAVCQKRTDSNPDRTILIAAPTVSALTTGALLCCLEGDRELALHEVKGSENVPA